MVGPRAALPRDPDLAAHQLVAELDRVLAISAEESAGGVEIKLLFAGGGAIWLSAEVIECRLQDLGGVWHTPIRPDHELE